MECRSKENSNHVAVTVLISKFEDALRNAWPCVPHVDYQNVYIEDILSFTETIETINAKISEHYK